ncbi:hypothetical protein Tco_1272651 [Tanacetum coccineum]
MNRAMYQLRRGDGSTFSASWMDQLTSRSELCKSLIVLIIATGANVLKFNYQLPVVPFAITWRLCSSRTYPYIRTFKLMNFLPASSNPARCSKACLRGALLEIKFWKCEPIGMLLSAGHQEHETGVIGITGDVSEHLITSSKHLCSSSVLLAQNHLLRCEAELIRYALLGGGIANKYPISGFSLEFTNVIVEVHVSVWRIQYWCYVFSGFVMLSCFYLADMMDTNGLCHISAWDSMILVKGYFSNNEKMPASGLPLRLLLLATVLWCTSTLLAFALLTTMNSDSEGSLCTILRLAPVNGGGFDPVRHVLGVDIYLEPKLYIHEQHFGMFLGCSQYCVDARYCFDSYHTVFSDSRFYLRAIIADIHKGG